MTEEIRASGNCDLSQSRNGIVGLSGEMLSDARSMQLENVSYCVPIAQLSTLGAGVSSLLPAFRTATQTTAADMTGLYRLANDGMGDTLKVAKDGNFWGAFKRADGSSKFAKLQSAGPLTQTSTVTLPIDPATMMMAAALFSIEQKLGDIEEMQRQILSFLEIEKESEIEADVETLVDMIRKYKYNWDNEYYLKSSHKMVLDMQRTARKNTLVFQKRIAETLTSKQLIIAQAKVDSTLKDLLKKFKYYRLSLYIYSLASLLEIMLSGNFKEEYIADVKANIETLAMDYRDLFGKCSEHLEKLGNSALEVKALKGLGTVGDAAGRFIGRIPKIKDGQVDELLQEGGARLKENANRMEQNALAAFAGISNPETGILTEKMQDLIRIYNHTAEIYFDEEKLYLVAGQ